MRDSIIFYRSFYESIKELPLNVQGKIYNAIFEYSLNFNEVPLTGLSKTIFTLIKPQLEANIKKYENGKKGAEFGKLGGRPKPLTNPKETPNEPPMKMNNDNVKIPKLDEIKVYFKENNYTEESAIRFYNYYSVADWKNKYNEPITNWKQQAQKHYFNEENKIKERPKTQLVR